MKFLFYKKPVSLISKSGTGFTLIEMLIYISILAVVSVLAINSTFGMLRAFSDIRVTRDINNTATVVLERMAREIRNANGIDGQSVIGSNPGKLVLNTKDNIGVGTTVEFFINGSTLRVKENVVDQGALHPQSVAIDNLVFYSLSNSASLAVRVELQLTGTRGDIQKTKKFYTTVVLRDSY